ncbi:unnamed protein product [Tilletia controversa]|uniref:Uncharacterized protein n=3 Tax=Tilletia TaxID=13289 RepID=A0A8X7MX40_9BASI|nr:hypothetical protein CF328_g3840 [Tilletia controversa]KAE8199062.1 hypothetical protein CF336_g1379 [Tilletia laevis]KAE8260700.1 hypothetical protein A4X03_0g3719 [Tilletia caries]KAE8202098.1 hypothetical protein CF335_g3549 [Tilletia laevis]KAE8252486.1 hypothetical protein A4X06_0g2157 [Tilletia controversa]
MGRLFYLSFQRPPPLQVRPSEAVKVCVTIKNDLRSETYDEQGPSITLRLVWAVVLPGSRDVRVIDEGAGAAVAIEWTGASCAFRVVEGLRAPSARSVTDAVKQQQEGSPWNGAIHLGVVVDRPPRRNEPVKKKARRSSDGADPLVWPLLRPPATGATREGGDEDGDEFVPLLSGPIQFLQQEPARQQASSSGGGGGGSKQNDLLRIFRLPGSSTSKGDVIVQEETGYELDKHIWDASIHLLRLLTDPTRTASLPSSLRLLDRIESCTEEAEPEKRAFNVVELGAGTAVVSIALARYTQQNLPSSIDAAAKVTFYATDLESALPLMRTNMAWNELIEPGIEEDEDQPEPEPEQHTTFPTACPSDSSPPPASPPVQHQVHLCPQHLDWLRPLPLTLPPKKIDLILISDCTYNPTFYQPLAQTIASLLAISSGSCVLGKKHRHEDEMGLWDVLRKAGLGVRLVDGWEHEEEGEERWGVWEVFAA